MIGKIKLPVVRSLYPLIFIALLLPLIASLIHPGFYPMQDDLQAFRIFEMDKCVRDLQIPCRWVPDMGYQYGSPEFNFYAPAVYYLGELIHLLGFQFTDSVKVLFIIGIIFSGIGMYIFLKDFLGCLPALVGTSCYLYSPYKALNIFVRGDLSEFFCFVLFPFIFWLSFKFVKSRKKIFMVWFGVLVGLLFLTHTLMSLIFLPITALWTLGLLVIEKKLQLIKQFILGGFLSVGLAAFFILPLVFEKEFVNIEIFTKDYFDYHNHFASLYQVFISNSWGYGASVWGDGDGMSFSVGLLQWVIGLGGVILAIINLRKKESKLIIMLSVIVLFCLFLTHQRSFLVWENISVMSFIQFPWRFLSVASFLLAIIDAMVIFSIKNIKLQFLVSFAIIVGLIFLNLGFFRPERWIMGGDGAKFSGESWEHQLEVSVHDYLPKHVIFPPDNKFLPQIKPRDLPDVLSGEASFKNYEKGSYFQKGQIVVKKEAVIRIPMFDFEGMKTLIDGVEVPHKNNDCRGLKYCVGTMSFKVGLGVHNIEAILTDTLPRKTGNVISIISLFIVGILLVRYTNDKEIHT